MRSLIDLASALSTYGGLLYFGKSTFLSFMSCLHTNRFSYEGCTIFVHYYSSLFNRRIHTNIHLFIHVIQSLFFSLFFLCMLVRIVSSKIYFLSFFLASLLIASIYYSYKNTAKTPSFSQICDKNRSKFFLEIVIFPIS